MALAADAPTPIPTTVAVLYPEEPLSLPLLLDGEEDSLGELVSGTADAESIPFADVAAAAPDETGADGAVVTPGSVFLAVAPLAWVDDTGAVDVAFVVVPATAVCTAKALPWLAASNENKAVAVAQHRVFSAADSQQ